MIRTLQDRPLPLNFYRVGKPIPVLKPADKPRESQTNKPKKQAPTLSFQSFLNQALNK